MAKLLPFTCFICERHFHHFNTYMGHIRKHKRWSVNFQQCQHRKCSDIVRCKPNECFQKTTQDQFDGSLLPPHIACVKSNSSKPQSHDNCGEKLNNHMLKESICSASTCKLSGSENKDSYSSTYHQAESHCCDYCDESFAKLDELAQHMKIHIDKFVSCPQCARRFHSEKARENHLALCVYKQESSRIKQKNGTYEHKNGRQKQKLKCKHCNKTYCNASALRKHLKVHKCVRTCTQCGRLFFYKTLFQQHTCLQKCLLCNESFTCKTAKVSHMRSAAHVNRHVKKYTCNQCGEKLGNTNALQNHTRLGQCPKCDESFTCQSARENHINIYGHHDLVKCKHCGKSFAHRISLLKHKCKLVCTECHKHFKSRRGLLTHSKMHKLPQRCTQCNCRFAEKSSLDRHMMRVHTRDLPSTHKCSQCEDSFHSQSALDSHMRIHKYPHKCTHCNESFPRKSTLESHMKMHKCVDEISFKKIKRSSVKKLSFGRHMRVHTHDRPSAHKLTSHRETHREKHRCSKCLKDFVSKSNLDRHEKAIHMQVHMCSQCAKCFKRKYQLLLHERTHTGLKPYQCNECGAHFGHKSTLNQHVANIHNNAFPFLCAHCGKSFKTKKKLKSHEINHIDPEHTQLYLCIHCGKGCSTKARLTVHERNHTKKPFGCSMCGARFSTQFSLQKHIPCKHANGKHELKKSHETSRIDTEHTPLYSCFHCGKGFFTKATFTVHERSHTKPFGCSTCGAKFSTKYALKTHVACKHTDKYEHIFEVKSHAQATKAVVKPYGCTTCEKSFAHQSSLNKHIAKVHIENKPYSCIMCPSRFQKKHGLHIHMRCHSGMN